MGGRGWWFPAATPTPPLVANDPCGTTQTSSFTLPATATTLSGFTVTVTCLATVDTVNSGPTVAVITATACNQPVGSACPGNSGPMGYIERRVAVTL
jgi:hypothetical protein